MPTARRSPLQTIRRECIASAPRSPTTSFLTTHIAASKRVELRALGRGDGASLVGAAARLMAPLGM